MSYDTCMTNAVYECLIAVHRKKSIELLVDYYMSCYSRFPNRNRVRKNTPREKAPISAREWRKFWPLFVFGGNFWEYPSSYVRTGRKRYLKTLAKFSQSPCNIGPKMQASRRKLLFESLDLLHMYVLSLSHRVEGLSSFTDSLETVCEASIHSS